MFVPNDSNLWVAICLESMQAERRCSVVLSLHFASTLQAFKAPP